MPAIALPANLPKIADARLPVSYERAKAALEACTRLDECKDWADKAAALASYAKQADDDSLQKCALRIQSRAIRRCGELLEQFQTHPQGGRPKGNGIGAGTVSQRQAADAAGMSKRQETTAVRVANVPEEVFEAAVESDNPPTITKLAKIGTTPQPPKPMAVELVSIYTPESTHIVGVMRELAEFCKKHEPAVVAHAVFPQEVRKLRARMTTVTAWLDTFLHELPEASC